MKHFWISSLLVLLLWQHPARAEPDITKPVISRLESEGFAVAGIKRTWLGRIVITARNRQNLREVVLNRTSGEVLRDSLFSLPEPANPIARSSPDNPTPTGGRDTPDVASHGTSSSFPGWVRNLTQTGRSAHQVPQQTRRYLP